MIQLSNDQHVPAGSPQGGQFASKGDANYASRTRRATHFDTPIKGPSGAVITHYDWKWKHEEKQIADDMKTVRVSDWDESQTNAATGREIVHHFGVTDAMGNHHTVSLETASRMLGYGKPTEMLASDKLKISAVKTLAKLKMELAVAESAHEQLKDQHSKYSTAAAAAKLEMPAVKSERIGDREHVFSLGSGPMLTQSIRWGQYDSEPPSLTPGTIAHGDAIKRIKENWTSAKLRERGITEPDSLYASSASIADLKKRIERAEKKIGMNTPQTINLDRGTKGDEGHFVTIEHHVVFIKDDTGTGANGRGGKFTKHGLEKKLMKHHESRGGFATHEHRDALAEDSGGDLQGRSQFTFHKTLPGEVRKHIENNPAARKLFRVTSNASDAKGADALASLGDKYFDLADEAAGGHMTQAITSAEKSDDPEARFHAAIYTNLPKTKTAQGIIAPNKLHEGHTFTINGTKMSVVRTDEGLHLEGDGYPSTPVDALSEIPIDKHSLKMGKKSVSREVVPFSAAIELSRKELTGGRWVTIHPHGGHGDGDYKRLYIKGDGTILAGPKAMVGKHIDGTKPTHEVREADHPQSPLKKESSFTAQTVDPNRQLGMFAKDKDGNAMEVGEKPGQASLFHDTTKAKPVVDKAQAKRDEDAKATTEMFPAKKAEDATDRREKMIRDAQALRYLAVKMIPDDMPTRAQLRVSDATTKGDIDKFIMQKYGVEADVARDASNQGLTERGTHKLDGNKVTWTGGGDEPTAKTHPDVAKHIDSIIANATAPKPTAADTIAKMKTDDLESKVDSNDLDGSAMRDLKAKPAVKPVEPVVSRSLAVFATVQDGGNAPAAKPAPLPDALPPGVSLDDIPLDLAVRAHSGTSFSPEVRGKTRQREYVEKMKSAYAEMSQHATTPEQKEKLASEFERYRKGYAEHYKAMLGSMSNIVSPMISGPANFPVRQMEKRNRWADNKREALSEFHEKAMNAARRNINPDWNGVVRADDPNAVAKIDSKLDQAKKWHETMKQSNAIVKKHSSNPAEARNQLTAIGLPEAWQDKILKPDYMGRTGFPSYALTNSNANIRRMESRSASVERMQSSAPVEQQHGDVTYSEHPDDARVRLQFPGKPDAETISALKSRGFKWSPSNGAWQRQLTENGKAAAREILAKYGKPTNLSRPSTLYLSAGTLEKDRPTDIPEQVPTHVNGSRLHLRWSDAAIAGKWVHPTRGIKIDIDDARISKWANGINTCLSRGVNLPICKDHKENADNVVGYIYGAKAENGTLKLLNGYIGQDSLKTARRNYLSVGIDPDFRDSYGNSYGEAIRHVALTPIPVISGQKGFIAASREDAQQDEVQHLVPYKETPMTDESLKKISDALGVEAVDEESAVDLACETLNELSREVSEANREKLELSAALDEAKAQTLELSAAEPVAEPKVDERLANANYRAFKLEIDSMPFNKASKDLLLSVISDGDKPNLILLSADAPNTGISVERFIEVVKQMRPDPKTTERTGVQTLSREVPDGGSEAVKPVNPYEDTIAKLNGAAK